MKIKILFCEDATFIRVSVPCLFHDFCDLQNMHNLFIDKSFHILRENVAVQALAYFCM